MDESSKWTATRDRRHAVVLAAIAVDVWAHSVHEQAFLLKEIGQLDGAATAYRARSCAEQLLRSHATLTAKVEELRALIAAPTAMSSPTAPQDFEKPSPVTPQRRADIIPFSTPVAATPATVGEPHIGCDP